MQENEAPTAKELLDACAVIFGTDARGSANFLKYLQTPRLKAAYRKKAFETHPDRAAALAKSALSLEERFKEISIAYEQLSTFLKYPRKYSQLNHSSPKAAEADLAGRKRRTHAAQSQRKPANTFHQGGVHGFGEHFWRGDLPARKLPLGRFLYYNGVISMRSLIEALVWQKKKRPMVGSIAAHWNLLAQNDIRFILSNRIPGEKFCECALRYRYISPHQLNLLLWRQRMLQPRIGKFFVNHDIVSLHEMEHIVEQLRTHNRKHWRK